MIMSLDCGITILGPTTIIASDDLIVKRCLTRQKFSQIQMQISFFVGKTRHDLAIEFDNNHINSSGFIDLQSSARYP
jgi:hypothetical protein